MNSNIEGIRLWGKAVSSSFLSMGLCCERHHMNRASARVHIISIQIDERKEGWAQRFTQSQDNNRSHCIALATLWSNPGFAIDSSNQSKVVGDEEAKGNEMYQNNCGNIFFLLPRLIENLTD